MYPSSCSRSSAQVQLSNLTQAVCFRDESDSFIAPSPATMHSRGGRGPCNPPFPHVSRVAAATNDGTLNAIVNNSVCSVDVPLGNVGSHQADDMLSLLQYPVSDSLDRGYCSDIFGDLPYTSAHLARQSLSEVALTPLNAPFNAGTSVVSVNLSHRSCASINTCRAMSGNKRGATESCGSGSVEASLRVAGADAVSGLGLCQAAGATSSLVVAKLDHPQEGHVQRRVEQAEQPLCDSSSANSSLFCMQSESNNQTRSSKATSQQEASAGTSRSAPKLMVSNGCFSLPMPAGKYARTNFALFASPAFQSKVNLQVLSEGSGPSNIERVRQQPGEHVMHQEAMSPCTTPIDVRAGQAKLWGLPAPLPPPLPLPCALTPQVPPLSSAPFALDSRIATLDVPEPLHSLAPPPSVHEPVDDLNSNKDTASGSKVSAVSAEKGAHTADQIATSPSQGSGSCAERTGIGTDKPFGHDMGLQSVEEMAAADKKYPLHAKRLRTAEMHNQSERRRRVKINDKLKTLQQLIPNGNKPDKASLLDAVIEYIKLLQSQLQMISLRTGIGIPPWMIPNMNMQHIQMPSLTQMMLTADMGMGMGAGLGMGMKMGVGVIDGRAPAVGSGCTIMPMPLFPTPSPSQGPTSLHPADRMQSPALVNFVYPYLNQNTAMYTALQQQSQPCSQPQEQQFQTQSKQQPPL